MSKINGGGLLDFIIPAHVVSLIISVVIGDKLDIIGSGLTYPVDKDYSMCWHIIAKYNLTKSLPEKALNYFKTKIDCKIKSEVKNYSKHNNFTNIIIGNNIIALDEIKKQSIKLGYITEIVNNTLEGEARIVGSKIAKDAVNFAKTKAVNGKKYCFLYAGETTVTIEGKGKGGRNQELVLGAAIELQNTSEITILSAGTDGNDGPTDAAGAICNGNTVGKKAKEIGINANNYLNDNNSYNFFKAINGLLITGPTGTNVMDIQIVLINK
jgi:glycerate-2-kinase